VNNAQAVNSIDITTREGANLAMLIVDRAIGQVSSDRAQLGAVQNRLDSTISNLSTTVENANAARSRILDADFAMETASLSRNQVLQQAGTSILAQANQQPQQVLSLLQGG
jgi:flagellin